MLYVTYIKILYFKLIFLIFWLLWFIYLFIKEPLFYNNNSSKVYIIPCFDKLNEKTFNKYGAQVTYLDYYIDKIKKDLVKWKSYGLIIACSNPIYFIPPTQDLDIFNEKLEYLKLIKNNEKTNYLKAYEMFNITKQETDYYNENYKRNYLLYYLASLFSILGL